MFLIELRDAFVLFGVHLAWFPSFRPPDHPRGRDVTRLEHVWMHALHLITHAIYWHLKAHNAARMRSGMHLLWRDYNFIYAQISGKGTDVVDPLLSSLATSDQVNTPATAYIRR